MKIHEEVSEAITINGNDYSVHFVHRDWNPLPGHTPPEGTLWEAATRFKGYDGALFPAYGVGSSKEEALHSLIFTMGAKVGLDSYKHHMKKNN